MVILQPLAREAILAPGFWKFSRPVPFLTRPVIEREARAPGLPESEMPVLWAALDAIPNVDLDYDVWRDVAYAVHWATGGSQEGLDRFEEWSARSGKHVPGYAELKVWSYADQNRVGGITAASLFKRAGAAGWVNPATAGVPDLDGFEMEGVAAMAESLSPDPESGAGGAIAGVGAGVVAKTALAPPDDYEPPAYFRDKQGVVKPTVENAVRAVSDPWEIGVQVAHDAFRDELLVAPAGTVDQWRPITDADLVAMRIKLEQRKFKAAPKELARDAVVLVASRNQFDSAQAWLEGIETCWDGQRRVSTFLTRYFSAEDTPYTRAVSRYIWTALAGRVIEPGCYAAMAPILEGAQGVGKSRGLKAMVPDAMFFGEIDFNKDETELARLLRGKLLCEINELRGLQTRDQESIKAWMARTHENWIPKFKEFATTFARRSLNIGTTNKSDILADETGERRWLPLHVGAVDVQGIEEAREQLWAEGAAMFHGLTDDAQRSLVVGGDGRSEMVVGGVAWREAEALARDEHHEFRRIDDWEGPIAEWLDGSDRLDGADGESVGRARGESVFTVADVLAGALGMALRDMDNRTQMRCGAVLRGLGYTKGNRRDAAGKQAKRWYKA